MTTYAIDWNIEIEADSAEDAARKALAIQRDKESIATVFGVGFPGFKDRLVIDAAPQREPRQAVTRDLGLAIRDFLEGQSFYLWVDDRDPDCAELTQSVDKVQAETIDCSDPDNLIVCLDNGQRFTVRIIAGADTRDAPPADEGSLDLDRALNAMRILRAIDKWELDAVGVTWGEFGFTWEAFRENPYMALMNASGDNARRVWLVVESRQPERLKAKRA